MNKLTSVPNSIEPIIAIANGFCNSEPMSEAKCMYDELVSMGIDPQRLLIEDQATSTWGNLTYSLDIIEEQTGSRPDTLGVVSNEFHLFRTGLQAEEYGLTIQGIPARTGSFDRWLHYFIREIAGVWHYILLGGQHR